MLNPISTLGEDSGAPNVRIAVELKDSAKSLKDAIDELGEAKENREAVCGIFVFTKGTEPAEVGDFRRIGQDFYCTVDRVALSDGRPLLFFDAAVKIARAMAIATCRKEVAGEADLQKVQDHVTSLLGWVDRISDMSTKAMTVQRSGKAIEDVAIQLKAELDERLTDVLRLLRR